MRRIRTQVIVNPESNQGRTRRRWKHIREAIRSFIHEFRYEFTEKPLQAIEITRETIRSGHELIIGVGGDGTMNEDVLLELDGEQLGGLPARFEILPRHLLIKCYR